MFSTVTQNSAVWKSASELLGGNQNANINPNANIDFELTQTARVGEVLSEWEFKLHIHILEKRIEYDVYGN